MCLSVFDKYVSNISESILEYSILISDCDETLIEHSDAWLWVTIIYLILILFPVIKLTLLNMPSYQKRPKDLSPINIVWHTQVVKLRTVFIILIFYVSFKSYFGVFVFINLS